MFGLVWAAAVGLLYADSIFATGARVDPASWRALDIRRFVEDNTVVFTFTFVWIFVLIAQLRKNHLRR